MTVAVSPLTLADCPISGNVLGGSLAHDDLIHACALLTVCEVKFPVRLGPVQVQREADTIKGALQGQPGQDGRYIRGPAVSNWNFAKRGVGSES